MSAPRADALKSPAPPLPGPLLVTLMAAALAALSLQLTPPPASASSEPRIALLKPVLAEMRPAEARTLRLVIENQGGDGDRLLGARSAFFGRAALVDREGAPLEALSIPPGAARALGPEGDAVLVLGAPSDFWPHGAAAEIELLFERSGPIRLELIAAARPSSGLKLTTAERTLVTRRGGGLRDIVVPSDSDR